jgi:hypothetical protein
LYLLLLIIAPVVTFGEKVRAAMIIKTRVFQMAAGRYHNLSELARAMGLSVSQVYRVREGKRGINEKFITGAKMAFPECRLDELFYFYAEITSDSYAEKAAAK